MADPQMIDNEWKTGNRAVARAMAETWVKEHPEVEDEYRNLDIPELVTKVDEARAAGDEETRQKIDAYLLGRFPPQNLVGTF